MYRLAQKMPIAFGKQHVPFQRLRFIYLIYSVHNVHKTSSFLLSVKKFTEMTSSIHFWRRYAQKRLLHFRFQWPSPL